MNKQSILAALAGLLVGAGLTFGVVMNTDKDESKTTQAHNADPSMMSMDEMTAQLKDKSGDDFDKAFTEMMIAHHQSAIAMANLIPTRAGHDEIKKLGQDIITAQNREITDMENWRTMWGYSSGDSMPMMQHR